jgi:hypothetical protein
MRNELNINEYIHRTKNFKIAYPIYTRRKFFAFDLCCKHEFRRITNSRQDSFAVGGRMIESSGTFNPKKSMNLQGQTLHGDHAYAFYQKPVNARK